MRPRLITPRGGIADALALLNTDHSAAPMTGSCLSIPLDVLVQLQIGALTSLAAVSEQLSSTIREREASAASDDSDTAALCERISELLGEATALENVHIAVGWPGDPLTEITLDGACRYTALRALVYHRGRTVDALLGANFPRELKSAARDDVQLLTDFLGGQGVNLHEEVRAKRPASGISP